MMLFDFEKLRVWQKGKVFVNKIYRITVNFPKEERFGLSQHMRRRGISILSNIAEGTSRFSKTDQRRFI